MFGANFAHESKKQEIEVVVYEPSLKEDNFYNSRVIRDIDEFKQILDIIVGNRESDELFDVEDKINTRDIYGRD